MSGLISTPVTRRWPKTSEVRMSRPPPTPITKHRSVLPQVVGQRRDVVFEMLERFDAAVEFGDYGGRTGIDVQIKLLELLFRRDSAGSCPNRTVRCRFCRT